MRSLVLMWVAVLVCTGCVRVAPHERGYLSQETMQPVVDPLEARAANQLHRSREAAGGGCGCTN